MLNENDIEQVCQITVAKQILVLFLYSYLYGQFHFDGAMKTNVTIHLTF